MIVIIKIIFIIIGFVKICKIEIVIEFLNEFGNNIRGKMF